MLPQPARHLPATPRWADAHGARPVSPRCPTPLALCPCLGHPPCLSPPQYCGSSLSRVGLDFQALLLPLFEACGLQLFAAHLSNAVDGFNLRLESHKWVPLPAPMMGRGRAAAAAPQQASPSAPAAGGEGERSG